MHKYLFQSYRRALHGQPAEAVADAEAKWGHFEGQGAVFMQTLLFIVISQSAYFRSFLVCLSLNFMEGLKK